MSNGIRNKDIFETFSQQQLCNSHRKVISNFELFTFSNICFILLIFFARFV